MNDMKYQTNYTIKKPDGETLKFDFTGMFYLIVLKINNCPVAKLLFFPIPVKGTC